MRGGFPPVSRAYRLHTGAAAGGGGGGGDLTHGASASFTGSGFGSKATAAPQAWDNCSHGQSIGTRWTLAWPNSSPSGENMDYRSAQRGISLPHSNASKYMCGCANGTGASSGANIMVWKDQGAITLPYDIYISYYFRGDDSWNFSGNNLKTFDWSVGSSGYDLPNNFYIEYRDPPSSSTSGDHPTWHLNDDTATYSPPNRVGDFLQDLGTSVWYGDSGANPFAGSWVKVEYLLHFASDSSGKIRVIENNVTKLTYNDYTDKHSQSGGRTVGIGGYTDMRNANNFQYFADVYLDNSWARLMLGNASTYSACTIVEPQIPTSWSGSNIDATINKGRLSSGTVYPYVFASGSETPIALPSRTMT